MSNQAIFYMEQCLVLGERILEAIHSGKWETFHTLVQQRQTYINKLVNISPEPTPHWKTLRTQLLEQQRALQQAATEATQHWEEQLQELHRLKQAAQQYNQPLARTQILHPELKG